MATDNDPLQRLFADHSAADRELLASILEERVSLNKGGSFQYRPKARSGLDGGGLILVALLARKALVLSEALSIEGLSPKELETVTGLPGGTLRPLLKRFSERGLVKREEAGTYVVPDFAVSDVAQHLTGGE
jgi:DNA-binding transcriptional ArsR family regulator